jgi:hypothetical protein
MANWKEGDQVQIVTREVTDEDRKANRYFSFMAGLTGTIQNIYGDDQIAVKIDPPSLNERVSGLHKASNKRMREKFLDRLPEEHKKQLTKEELSFEANFMLLVRSADLVKL